MNCSYSVLHAVRQDGRGPCTPLLDSGSLTRANKINVDLRAIGRLSDVKELGSTSRLAQISMHDLSGPLSRNLGLFCTGGDTVSHMDIRSMIIMYMPGCAPAVLVLNTLFQARESTRCQCTTSTTAGLLCGALILRSVTLRRFGHQGFS